MHNVLKVSLTRVLTKAVQADETNRHTHMMHKPTYTVMCMAVVHVDWKRSVLYMSSYLCTQFFNRFWKIKEYVHMSVGTNIYVCLNGCVICVRVVTPYHQTTSNSTWSVHSIRISWVELSPYWMSVFICSNSSHL